MRAAATGQTSQAAEFAHGGKHRRLHLDVADPGFIGSVEVVLLLLLRVGAEGAIQTGLTWAVGGGGVSSWQRRYGATRRPSQAPLLPS